VACAEHHSIEHQIHGAGSLMKIDVAAPTVIGCQVKHHAHSVDGAFRHVHLTKISLDEIHLAGFDELADILGFSAAQIVDHPNDCASCHERIDQIGANEGSASSYESPAVLPVHDFSPTPVYSKFLIWNSTNETRHTGRGFIIRAFGASRW
jgi:hypothetical protein